MRTLLRLALGGALFVAGCGGDDDESPPGRGSAACQDFQDSACDFGADRCGSTNRAACDHAFKGIECKSDEAASACANALNGASCGQAVSGCDLDAIIDPAPAVMRCEQLIDKVCDHFVACGSFPNRETCAPSLGMTSVLSCDNAVSTSLSYETCMEQIGELSCQARMLPSVCNAAISVLPPGLLGGG